MDNTIVNKKEKLNSNSIIVLLLFLFFILVTDASIATIGYIRLPVTRVLVMAIVVSIMAGLSLMRHNLMRVEILSLLLLLRVLYFLTNWIPINTERPSFIAYIFIISIGWACYSFIYYKINSPDRLLEILLKLSVLILFIQVGSCFIRLVLSGHGLYQIKLAINIPLGNSNTIASIALFLGVLSFFYLENKIYFVISMLSLLSTLSKGAFISFAVVVIICVVVDANNKNRLTSTLRYIIGIITIMIVINHFLSLYFSEYISAIDSVLNRNLDTINNGRLSIFGRYLKLILQHPIIGWGVGAANSINNMTHNFILQGLYFGGIIGTILYYIPIIVVLSRGSKIGSYKERYSILLGTVALLIHGLVENVFFTEPCEFFYWIFIPLFLKAGTKYNE